MNNDFYNQNYNQNYDQNLQPYVPNGSGGQPDDGKGFAIASLVLGILSFFCFGTICSILGLIFGVISKKKKPYNNGMATAGIVLSIITLVLGIISIIIICVGACVSANSGSSGYYYYYR